MRQHKALALLMALCMAAPLQVALIAPPAIAAPTPLALINGTQFAGTQYLVVTPLSYSGAMQSIADWKTQKGLPARVAILEDVLQSYTGRDNAEKVHNFLQDVYFNGTDRGLKYVLLGGGSALVPTRLLHTGGSVVTSYTSDDTLSDVYFAGLNGDWDANGNGTYGEYGEADWDAEVYVGRLPFNSPAEAGFARDNILSYERSPFVGSWMQSAAAFASVMDPPNDATAYSWWEDNAVRSIWNTQPYLPAGMTLDLLADYYELDPGNYTTGLDRLSNASMVASINAGKSVVMSATHGWVPSGRGIPEYRGFDGIAYSWGDGLTYQNASSMTNFGMLSFGYFSSCIIGNFSNPSLPTFARFVVQDNHGFIAEVVPTDGTLRGEDDFNSLGIREGNWWQSENFWKNFFNGTDPFRPGPALYQGIRDYDAHMETTGRDTTWPGYANQKAVYNLLGDPEIPIWTAVAQNFNATLPTQVYTAESHFRATFRDPLLRPAAGATVALMGPGVYAVGTTDAQGRVDILIAPSTTGNLRVTATLHNFLPFEGNVPVVTAPADLAIGASNVTLPGSVLRTGVTVPVDFTVRNVGQLSASSADARATATPPGGLPQVVAPSVSLGAIAPGASSAGSFNWTPAEDGLWSLDIIVDPADAVPEFDELNNAAALPVYASSVDLAFAPGSVTLNPPGQVVPGGVVQASGALEVAGLVPRSYLVGFELLRGDSSVASSGNAVMSTTDGAFALEVPVPEGGAFTLRLTVDAAGEVVEFNEDNNTLEFDVRAGAGPSIFALPAVLVDEDAPPTRVISDLRGYIADPDTPFAELVVTAAASAPQLAVWVDGFALVAQPAPGWSGTGTVTLTAADAHDSGSSTTPFTVRAVDRAPTLTAPPPLNGTVGEPFVYQVDASDPEGGALTYSISESGPAAFRALPIDSGGKIAFVPPDALAGSWTFTVFVRDAGNHTASATLRLSVLPVNHAPVFVDLGVFEVQRGANTSFALAALDADGDPLSFYSNSTRALVHPNGTVEIDRFQATLLPEGESVIPVFVSDGVSTTTGFVRVRLVDPPAPAPYGGDLAVSATLLLAIAAMAVGAAFTLRRRKD